MEQTLTLNINGQQHTVTTDPDRPLLDVLREDLGLTGEDTAAASGNAAHARCSPTAGRSSPARRAWPP